MTSLTQQLSDVTNERDALIKVVNELRCQIDDYRKIYGSVDDLSELRHHYESLLEDEYVVVNNVAYCLCRCNVTQ